MWKERKNKRKEAEFGPFLKKMINAFEVIAKAAYLHIQLSL